MKDYFELGKILKPQGIKGEVKFEGYTDNLERFLYLDFVYFKDSEKYIKVKVEKSRIDYKFAYLKLKGYDTRDDAERLRQELLYIHRDNAVELEEGYFYIQDLIGLMVTDENNCELGVLKDIMQTGTKDIYAVKVSEKQEFMFPSIEGIIISRDLDRKVMVVDSKKLSEVCIYNDI